MNQESRKLLDYIVSHFVLHDELVSIDLDASASEAGDSIETEKRQAARRDHARADELAGAFAEGLARANDSRAAGQDELTLDDRDPKQNQIADALIQFLVSHHLAASRSEPTTEYHYVYSIAVDWEKLGEVANAAGIDLERAIQHGS
ncbi:MAG: hypothetical protein ACJ789_03590 [Thermomicrobiales bacterium]